MGNPLETELQQQYHKLAHERPDVFRQIEFSAATHGLIQVVWPPGSGPEALFSEIVETGEPLMRAVLRAVDKIDVLGQVWREALDDTENTG